MDLLQKRQHERVLMCGVVLGYQELRKKTLTAARRSSTCSTAKIIVCALSSTVRAMLWCQRPGEKVLMSDGVQSSLDLEELMKHRECCKLDMKSDSKGVRSWSLESERLVR